MPNLPKNENIVSEYDYYLYAGHSDSDNFDLHSRGGTRDWLIVFTLEGYGRYARLPVGPGDLVLIAPGTPYDSADAPASPVWRSKWAHFNPRPHWLDLLHWPEFTPGLMHLATDSETRDTLTSLFTRMVDYWDDRIPRKMLSMNMLEQILLQCAGINPLAVGSRIDLRLRTAIDYIRQNIAYEISVADLARISGLSPSRFAHIFSAAFGISPQKYIEDRRIELARQRLFLSRRSIREIAAEAGFKDQLYFSRRFRKYTGLSPSEFRDQF